MFVDDDLTQFAAEGSPALPGGGEYLDHDGARIWFASYGTGPAVVLLHGGMGNAGNFGHQVPDFMEAGYRVVVMDTRGQGRSSWDGRPFSYEQFASDVLAVLDTMRINQAAIVGWSDGACTALELARAHPGRVSGVLFFACNVNPDGVWPFAMTPTISNCLMRHQTDYLALSPSPDGFEAMSAALQLMQASQPNYTAQDLSGISVPVLVLQAEHDEFIRPEHARFIAQSLRAGRYAELPGVSHFAPVQRPDVFNAFVRKFLEEVFSQVPEG